MDYGLREPLYVTALRHAGVEPRETLKPAYLHTVDITASRDAILDWYESVPDPAPREAGDEVLAVHNLNFEYYPGRPVLSDLELRISAGEMLAIVGTNGAGKSTTIRMLCGLLPPTSGEALVGGEDVKKNPEGVKRIQGGGCGDR